MIKQQKHIYTQYEKKYKTQNTYLQIKLDLFFLHQLILFCL